MAGGQSAASHFTRVFGLFIYIYPPVTRTFSTLFFIAWIKKTSISIFYPKFFFLFYLFLSYLYALEAFVAINAIEEKKKNKTKNCLGTPPKYICWYESLVLCVTPNFFVKAFFFFQYVLFFFSFMSYSARRVL